MRPDRWREHVARGRRSTFQIFDDALQGKEPFQFRRGVGERCRHLDWIHRFNKATPAAGSGRVAAG